MSAALSGISCPSKPTFLQSRCSVTKLRASRCSRCPAISASSTRRVTFWLTRSAKRWHPRCGACMLAARAARLKSTAGIFYVKPANRVENRRDRRLRQNQSGKRKVVVVIRERNGKTLPGVFASEVAALNFIRTRIAKGTEVYADEGSAWNELHGRFTMHRINHQEAYSLGDGIHSNNAESFFSRMRRAEIGHHHYLAGPYLIRFAQEASWREDHRKDPNGVQVDRVIALAMRNKPSVDFCGYWQRSWAA
jgi:hypothetical protein